MKKVIILCSALVFDFLTCSDVSAAVDINSVNYQNAREAIEDELTELLKASNEKEVKLYINEFESRLNSSPKKAWLNSSEMTIKNGSVKFRDPKSKGYKSDPKLFRDYLSDVRKRINQLKAQTRSKRKPATSIPWASRTPQNMQNNTEQSQNVPEPASLIPWPSQNSSSGQNYTENNQIEGGQRRLALPAPDANALQFTRERSQIEGGQRRLALPAPDVNALQFTRERSQIEGGQRRLALPAPDVNALQFTRERSQIEERQSGLAPDSGGSEVNNSRNQDGWVDRENLNLQANQYMDHLEEASIEDQEAWLNREYQRRNIENGSNAIDYAPPIQDYNPGGNSATIGGGGVPTLPGK